MEKIDGMERMMKLSAVLFDLDGTLLDTLEDLADSVNAALAEAGLPPHPLDAYRFFVGDGMENLARRAAPAGTDESRIKKLVESISAVYGETWRNKTRPYPGITALLDRLDEAGVAMAVLSNKPDVFTQAVVKHFFGENRFRVVRGARDGIPRKPDPAAAAAIAGELGVPAGRFLYLGDTDTDMRTGRAAGMRTIGVSWGFRPAAELLGAGAQGIIDSPEEAMGLLSVG